MPNWVKVFVHALDENVDFGKFANEKGDFTFEKIIPMPSNIYRGDLGDVQRQIYAQNNWYDWSVQHWGTKWDACESNIQDNLVAFETAWSCPVPVLKKLGEKVGGLLVFFADEDIGSNCGAFFVKKDGSIVDIPYNYIVAETIFSGLDVWDRECIHRFKWLLGFDEEE